MELKETRQYRPVLLTLASMKSYERKAKDWKTEGASVGTGEEGGGGALASQGQERREGDAGVTGYRGQRDAEP